MNVKKIVSSVGICAVGFLLAAGFEYAAAWTGPSTSPPGGNISAPINISSSAQAKAGNLALGTTTTQTSTLDVEGTGYIQGLIIGSAFQLLPNAASGTVLESNSQGYGSWVATSSLGVSASAIPSGAIMAFNLSTCPSGWTTYTAAYGRAIIGSGPSTSSTTARTLGAIGGLETEKLTAAQLPSISVTGSVTMFDGTVDSLTGSGAATVGRGSSDPTTVTSTGGGSDQPLSTMQPFVADLYCQKS